jgi:hypothetical protein
MAKPAAPLIIRLKKTPDAPPVLTGVRADGTVTWQRAHIAFPVHDLVHYSVESRLGLRDAFFGLIAAGWNLEDFGQPWPKGPLPAEALYAEQLVGEIWRAFVQREPLAARDLNQQVSAARAHQGLDMPRMVTDSELEDILARLGELALRWRTLPPGGTMELRFPPD